MKWEKRTSGGGTQRGRRHWNSCSWGTEGAIRKKGRDQQRRTGGEGRVFWSRWSAVPSLAQTLTQMCPSLEGISILQGKTRPPGWVEGWGERKPSAEVLSKGLKDTVCTAQKEVLRREGKTLFALVLPATLSLLAS